MLPFWSMEGLLVGVNRPQQTIAPAWKSLDKARLPWLNPQGTANYSDVLDQVGLVHDAPLPDRFDQLLFCEYLIGVFNKDQQRFDSFARQLDRLSISEQNLGSRIQTEIREFIDLSGLQRQLRNLLRSFLTEPIAALRANIDDVGQSTANQRSGPPINNAGYPLHTVLPPHSEIVARNRNGLVAAGALPGRYAASS